MFRPSSIKFLSIVSNSSSHFLRYSSKYGPGIVFISVTLSLSIAPRAYETLPVRRLKLRTSFLCSGRVVLYSLFLKLFSFFSHTSPESIRPSIARSLVTTVHVQQPNRELPQEGVLVSITRGHSPALESL